MIRAEDVNTAMLQQAAEELEIGVPIRAWRVQDGQLVLSLAYGGEAAWSPESGSDHRELTAEPARPWRFVETNRKPNARRIPKGNLKKFRRQQLLNVALDWGFQSTSHYVRKAELVEALAWLKKGIGG